MELFSIDISGVLHPEPLRLPGPEARARSIERRDAGEDLALEQLERRAAARRDEGDLVLHVELGGGSRRVAAADDALVALRRRLGDGLEHGLGALGEGIELEDARRAVPDDRLRLEHLLAEERHRRGTAVHALPALGDALGLRDE